jgi:nucleotide-binding universal stress UspA family protein
VGQFRRLPPDAVWPVLMEQEASLKKILVATDGSATSERALRQGVEFAKTTGAELSVVNVVEAGAGDTLREFSEVELNDHAAALGRVFPLVNAPGGMGALAALRMVETHSRALDEFACDRVLDEAERLATGAGVATINRVAAVGDTATEIVKAANSMNADLIVMGRRGLSPVVKLLLGSVTQKVLHRTNRNVLIVA